MQNAGELETFNIIIFRPITALTNITKLKVAISGFPAVDWRTKA